jgi:hypothetical protein
MKIKYFIALLLGILIARGISVTEAQAQQQKKKVAILHIDFKAGFSEADRSRIRARLHQQMALGDSLEIVSEAKVREQLISDGIDPAVLRTVGEYTEAGRTLKVDYVLVGKMEKLGDLLDVSFQIYPTPKDFTGIKKIRTVEAFIEEEIPEIARDIRKRILPIIVVVGPEPPVQEPAEQDTLKGKKSKKSFFIIGAVILAGTSVVVWQTLSDGPKNGEKPVGLPIPPSPENR